MQHQALLVTVLSSSQDGATVERKWTLAGAAASEQQTQKTPARKKTGATLVSFKCGALIPTATAQFAAMSCALLCNGTTSGWGVRICCA